MIPPAPPTWAIKDKFSGIIKDNITMNPIPLYYQYFRTLHSELKKSPLFNID
jgi:hypothetical protein